MTPLLGKRTDDNSPNQNLRATLHSIIIDYPKPSTSIAFGYKSDFNNVNNACALGSNSEVKKDGGIAIGSNISVNHNNSIVIGVNKETVKDNTVIIGDLELTDGNMSIADNNLSIFGNNTNIKNICSTCDRSFTSGLKWTVDSESNQRLTLCFQCIFDCVLDFKSKLTNTAMNLKK